MTLRDFSLVIEGYNQRMNDYERIARLQAYYSSPVELQGKITFEKFKSSHWIMSDEVEKQKGKHRRLLDRLKQEKEKMNGNGKTGNTG